MDKMKMAHEWAMRAMIDRRVEFLDADGLAWKAWAYADAMQAEAEKRKPSGLPDALKEEWQPDWSQAPDDATAWEYLGYEGARWHTTKKGVYRYADLFGYSGTDMLLVERPQ